MKPASRRHALPIVLVVVAIAIFAAADLSGFESGKHLGAMLDMVTGNTSADYRQTGDFPVAATTGAGEPETADSPSLRKQGAAGDGNSPADDNGATDGADAAEPDVDLADQRYPDTRSEIDSYGLSGNSAVLAAMLDSIGAAGPDDRTRAAEAFVAAAAGSSMDDVMAATLPMLNDWDPDVRYYGLVALGASALAAPRNAETLALAAPQVMARMTDDSAMVREAAAAVIAAVQPAPPGWTAGPLADALSDSEPRVVAAAQASLELIGPAGSFTAETVSADLYADDPMLRSRAVRTLGAVAGNTDSGLSSLVWALGDPDSAVRWQAATALGEIGPDALAASYQLSVIAEDATEDPGVRDAADTALNSILE